MIGNYFFSNSGAAAGYQIEQSLRFDGSSHLSWTPSSAGNRRTSTFSVWFKPTTVGGEIVLFSATGYTKIAIDSGGLDHIWFQDYDGSVRFRLETSASLRDPSAWYHLIGVVDTTNATASDRVRLYLNGERISAFGTNTQPSQNFDTDWSNTVEHKIGSDPNPFYFRGYMAECHFIDGTAVTDALDFGEYDDNGVWRPIEYTGSYGTNGFYLKFDPSATNGIGHDHSGNGNNFSPTGFTTSGTGTDVMSDTPTTNWCTLNPLTSTLSYGTITNGNLDMSGTNSTVNITSSATQVLTTGKYYWETTLTAGKAGAGSYPRFGFLRAVDAGYTGGEGAGYTNSKFQYASQGIAYQSNGSKTIGGTETSYGNSYDNTDTIGIAYDGDNGAIYFSRNNIWQNSGDPTSGASKTGAALTWTDDRDYVFQASHYNGTASSFNFGQRDFRYTPPTGYVALNTSNLPAPDIADGSDYFQTVLYTGNNTTHAITVADNSGNAWGPDFVWIKPRSTADHHRLNDKVRGVNKTLSSNLTNAEYGPSNAYLDSFDSGGFTISSSNIGWNNSSHTYVAWNWLAGGTGSSNTAGSITSTVSANPSAGFSIVSYGGNSTAGATVGHGLGVAPKAFVIKNRDDSVARWSMYHVATGATGYMRLDGSPKFISDSVFNNTAPSSTTFTLGSGYYTNRTGDDYIAYCFAEVENYSRINFYTGNGNNDGPFIATSFTPAWLLIKRTDTDGYNWTVFDSERRSYNVNNHSLNPNNINVEETAGGNGQVDFLSNGFKVRNTDGGVNASGATYLYIVFASNPFGGSGVSPATAR
jgi:hypothetical protein